MSHLAQGQEAVLSVSGATYAVDGGVIATSAPAAVATGAAAPQAEPAKGEAPAANKPQEQAQDAKKETEAKPEGDGTVKRPKTPPRVPDPREFDARLDANSRVQFAFHGQSWPDVLQWVATVGGYSLDWQELPDDYVNVSTERPYTVTETRDLINRLLFERGYTMLIQNQLITVAKIDKLDPSLIPRVEDESELMDLPTHTIAKFTFLLPDQLKADQAAADVKLLLSPHGKVHPLMATNRLLVIDAVGNLRVVSQLVNAEHAAATGHAVPREFVLKHARADRVADQVMILLGLDPSSRRTPEELQVEQQRLQLFAQMQQRGADVSKYLRSGEMPTMFVTVNHHRNSVLVNAPPAEMEIVARAVEILDAGPAALSELSSPQLSMKKYQTVTISPQTIANTLEEIGELAPQTRLRVDADSNTLVANATADDHQKIEAVIDRLDGTGRQLEVIWLRRLPADSVAATIYHLLVGDEEDEEDSGRSPYYYYSYYDRPRESKKQKKDSFRIDADIENNRLLLWANASELEEVRKLLAKLGELPGTGANPHTIRRLHLGSTELTKRLIDQLQQAWPAVGPNELQIEYRDGRENPAAIVPATIPPRTIDEAASHAPAGYRSRDREVSLVSTSSRPTEAPIRVVVTEDGQVVISSEDPESLDRLEELLDIIAPPPKDYAVFYLKYALASLVTLNLEEYFEDEESASDKSAENYWRGWYGFDMDTGGDDGPSGLSRRKKIRFIYDLDTNSILVANGTREQLQVVESLIEVYDKPPSDDSISARRFRMFQLRHARAEDVASAVKEVYRDLLSSKDKEFADANRKDEKEQSSQTAGIYRIYSGPAPQTEGDDKPQKVKATFAGALSVGVDKVSNTVIISAQEEWMSSIAEMIEYLDRETMRFTSTTRVVSTRVDPRVLQAALARLNGSQTPPPANGPTTSPLNIPSQLGPTGAGETGTGGTATMRASSPAASSTAAPAQQ